MRIRDKEFYDSWVGTLSKKLETEDWNTEHITYIFIAIIDKWWSSRRSWRTICEVGGTLKYAYSWFFTKHASQYKNRMSEPDE